MTHKYDPNEDALEERLFGLEVEIEDLMERRREDIMKYLKYRLDDGIIDKQMEYKILTGDFYKVP